MSNSPKVAVYTLHGDELSVQQRTHLRMSLESEQYKHLRKAIPADVPLTRTLKWMERLPDEVQPTALMGLHARVANLIAATWADPKSFNAYIDSLLKDRRGNRRGFPPEIVAELVALKDYYNNRTDDENDFTWHHISKRG